MDDWTDPQAARNWSADPTSHNPVRAEQLDILVSILADEYRQGKTILDVGLGSGIVEELIFRRLPGAQVVGIDSSAAMVALAHERLLAYKDQYQVVMCDIRDIGAVELPKRDYQIAISVQTIHNVADEHKIPIFDFIYKILEKEGLFLLLDRIKVDTPSLFSCYKSVWERLNRVHEAAMREDDTFEEHTERVEARGDLPATLEQHLDWLREVGFEVACLHLHGNRALFAARKT